jgi:NADH-quinone oxidoreductase subunit J
MTAQQVLFYVLAGLAVLSALAVVTLRHPIHSAFALIATLFFLAGIFVLLDAHFVAAIQVIVYAGAVMVLFTFVIMLLNLSPEELGPGRITGSKILGVVLLGFAAYAIVHAFAVRGPAPAPPATLPPSFGGIENVGRLLFTKYLFPFEIVSVLLLAAVVGAVVLAKKRLA